MESLGSSKEMAESKILILYIIKKLNMPVGNLHIVKFIMKKGLMNYFMLQQFLDELIEDKMLAWTESIGKELYEITLKGSETLSLFINLIPAGLKHEIDTYIKEIKRHIRQEISIKADYTPENEYEYTVACSIKEGDFTLLDLKLTVGDKKEARNICRNWEKHTQQIYLNIINAITKDRS